MQPTSFSSWYAPITAVALPLAAAWILFIGLSAASYRLANSRFAVTANDERWVDVSDEASNLRSRTRRVRTGRILELTGVALILWSAVLVFTAIALPWPILLGLLTTFAARKFGPYLAFAFVVGTWGAFAVSPEPSRQALLMLAIATWIYILGRRWTRRKYPAYRRGVDQPTLDDWLPAPGIEWRRPWGRAIAGSTVVALLTVGLLYTYAAAKWAAIAGAGELQSVISTARALPLGNLFWWRVLVVVIATARFGTAELLLISGMAAIYLLNGLVLRLWAPDPWDVISRRDPRAFVYLRNFGDDRTRIRAGTYTRVPFLQVIFDVLVPVRRRPFEQVMASLLARHGPVIGAADPRVSGRRVGVLKVALPHQSWSTDVTQWCESAIAVVVSATPATIQDGLREELKLLSSKISHQRIILILGPGKQDDLRRRFADFKAAWPAGSPLLDGLDDERAVSGTLVMVRVPGKGWDCWGSRAGGSDRRRSERQADRVERFPDRDGRGRPTAGSFAGHDLRR